VIEVVPDVVRSSLAEWGSFYVITGSAAAALTGLQFVVMALIAETNARRDIAAIDAFGTPTIVHFCAVLYVSSVLSAPWHTLSNIALALGAGAATGAGYAILVTRRAVKQTAYTPVLEDWIWHSMLPMLVYAALLVAALTLSRHVTGALFVTAGATVLMLFVGIHNAWDTVTYITVEQLKGDG
jgi:hypothetical protein